MSRYRMLKEKGQKRNTGNMVKIKRNSFFGRDLLRDSKSKMVGHVVKKKKKSSGNVYRKLQ